MQAGICFLSTTSIVNQPDSGGPGKGTLPGKRRPGNAPTACLINIGGHPEKVLHSDTLRATKSRRRAAETYLQRDTQAGRDWPVYVPYRARRCVVARHLPLQPTT